MLGAAFVYSRASPHHALTQPSRYMPSTTYRIAHRAACRTACRTAHRVGHGSHGVGAGLWNAYRDERQLAVHQISFHEHGTYLRKECLQYMTLPVAAILIWLLLLLAATQDDDLFWDALI